MPVSLPKHHPQEAQVFRSLISSLKAVFFSRSGKLAHLSMKAARLQIDRIGGIRLALHLATNRIDKAPAT